MNWFQTLRPSFIPEKIRQEDDLLIWREHLLQTILLFTPFAAVSVIFLELAPYRHSPILINILVWFGVTLALMLLRNLPFTVRANTTIVLYLLVGISSLLFFGIHVNALLYLLAAAIFTGIFFGSKAGMRVLIVALMSLVGVSLLHIRLGLGTFFNLQPLDSTTWSYTLSVAIHTALLGNILIQAIYALFNRLNTSLNVQLSMTTQLKGIQGQLEKSVFQRTKDLERRVQQIRAASTVSRAVTTMLDPQTLLQQVADLMQTEMQLYYVGIFLINPDGTFAELKAATGSAGQEMLARRHRLEVGGHSMIGWATIHLLPRIALDTGEEAIRFNNPFLPDTHSELALPLLNQGQCFGAISIQSTFVNAFDEDDMRVFESIADSIAVALQNAHLFAATNQQLREIQTLDEAYIINNWDDLQNKLDDLEYTYQSIDNSGIGLDEKPCMFPIRLRDQMIGQLTVEPGKSTLTAEDQEFIEGVLNQTAIALENARLIMDTQRQAGLELKISEMEAQFSQANTIDDVLRKAIEELAAIPNIEEISIQMLPSQDPPSIVSTTPGGTR